MSAVSETEPGRVGALVRSLRDYLAGHPHKAVQTDSEAVATIDGDLRCRVGGPGVTVTSDMSSGLGGRGVFPSPGWYLRAGVAACAATTIALRASELGIELTHLTVRANSRSDNRGMLGIGDADAGPESVTLDVEIAAAGVDEEELTGLVAYADAHAPNSDALRRAIPLRLTTTVVES